MTAFGKHAEMTVHEDEPFNAETPLERLGRDFLTPRGLFFSRNHGSIPEVDPHAYRLSVGGMVDRKLELSMEDLRAFPKEDLVAVMECAGNRRVGLTEVAPIPGETPWGAGAVGNTRWAGAPLRDVLLEAGVGEDAKHAAFSGLDEVPGEVGSTNYGGSIPLQKALSQEVLLAYEMNGEALPREHGFPLRVVAPGYVGARNVKWLSGIVLQEAPSDNYYQAHEYKLFPPDATEETANYSQGLMLGEMQVNAAICEPTEGEELSARSVSVRGYAIAGGGRSVERVDVSADGGRTWAQASLTEGADDPWAWTLWEVTVDLGPGEHRLVARALDSGATTQPASAEEVWNFKGYANNSWHGVRVVAR
jgi:sulfite oxidase